MRKLGFLIKGQKSNDGSAAPYFIAWMMGVPGSILFLVFVLRGCH